MEKMFVSKLTSDLIIKYKNNYEKEKNIFNKYYSLIVNKDFTFDKQIYMQSVISELNLLDKGPDILTDDDLLRYETLINEDMDYNTRIIIEDLKKEQKINKIIRDKYELNNLFDDQTVDVNKEQKYWNLKLEKDKEFNESMKNP